MPRISAKVLPFPLRRRSGPLLADLIQTIRGLVHDLSDTYHPERHYMRGPGPAWHAKHDRQSAEIPAGVKIAA